MARVCGLWDRPRCMDSPTCTTHQQQKSAAGFLGHFCGSTNGSSSTHRPGSEPKGRQQQGVRQQQRNCQQQQQQMWRGSTAQHTTAVLETAVTASAEQCGTARVPRLTSPTA
jgi:hypothetical protein